MKIRQEENKDFDTIHELIKISFQSAEYTDGNEQDLVNELWKGNGYIKELSLVAEIDGNIIGHIMFTKVKIGDSVQLALAPLSVLLKYQKQGIGGMALIKEGHKRAVDLGYEYSIVLGNDKYYSKIGYLPAKDYRIFPPFDVPSKNFMVCKLVENVSEISGIVQYAKEFGI